MEESRPRGGTGNNDDDDDGDDDDGDGIRGKREEREGGREERGRKEKSGCS